MLFWRSGTCHFIDKSVKPPRKTGHPTRVVVCTLGDPLTCMSMLFVCHSSLVGKSMSMKFFNKHIFEHQQENLSMKGLGRHMLHEQFQARFSQVISETASAGPSTCAPLDPTDEERLRNQCWFEVVGRRY
ncbi:uncharacterized protein LOC106752865 [Vigna radiata var. radiata]|uniref:Uncharacterized protein LOC106752865 n=1 Tax=Vigna radiata var. radiata TaxID=3916 RepID=A0A1S3T8N4_VIGRR|nr:uncharacterized protein LOC106752865 [Vigna radiata var. radiata]